MSDITTEELEGRIEDLEMQISQLENEKHYAYIQRNYLAALLAHCMPDGHAGIRDTAIEGWDPDWNGTVYIDLPAGQISFHYHKDQAHLFEGLPAYEADYDGHSKQDVYERILGQIALSRDERQAQKDAPVSPEAAAPSGSEVAELSLQALENQLGQMTFLPKGLAWMKLLPVELPALASLALSVHYSRSEKKLAGMLHLNGIKVVEHVLFEGDNFTEPSEKLQARYRRLAALVGDLPVQEGGAE